MAISRIKTDSIQDDAVTSPKFADNPDFDGQFVRVPHGTTAQRPSSPVGGHLRFNTDLGTLEQYNTNTNAWAAIDSPPILSSLTYSGSSTAADPAGGETITLTGTNFKTGFTVTVGGTTAASTTFVNTTTVRFTTPAKTAGDYDIVFTNSNGLAATLSNGISFNGIPAFTTAAGNVGSVFEDEAMPTITIVAAEPDSGTVSFSVTSGALPTGTAISSAGAITGTPNVNVTLDTTYNFSVRATDDENQTTDRAFNLIVLRPVYIKQINRALKMGWSSSSSNLSKALTGSTSTYTFSMWIKKWQDKSTNSQATYLWGCTSGAGVFNETRDNFASDRRGTFNGYNNPNRGTHSEADSFGGDWQHIVCQVNSGTAKLYVNGIEDPRFADTLDALSGTLRLGSWHNEDYIWHGVFAEVHFVDGQALTPSTFGVLYNDTWIPKEVTLTTSDYGTNGFHLDFEDGNNYGNDVSGNNNDLTANNLNDSDYMEHDSPTKDAMILQAYSGNVGKAYNKWGSYVYGYYNNGGNYSIAHGNWSVNSGKWYFECKHKIEAGAGNNSNVGWFADDYGTVENLKTDIRLDNVTNSPFVGLYIDSYNDVYRYIKPDGQTNGSNVSSSFTNNTTWGCAVDFDAGKMWWSADGTWLDGDPAAGTGAPIEFDAQTSDGYHTTGNENKNRKWTPIVQATASSDNINRSRIEIYFGWVGSSKTTSTYTDGANSGMKYAPPTGFKTLRKDNLPEVNTTFSPKHGTSVESHFDVVTYRGDGTADNSKSISTTCQPDLVWIKDRENASMNWRVFSQVYKSGSDLVPWFTGTTTQATDLANNDSIQVSSNAFTLGDVSTSGSGEGRGGINEINKDHIAVCWKLGGAAVANPHGTISSTISVNTTTQISSVRYTGINATGTIGHGLSGPPDFAIFSEISGGSNYNIWVWSRHLSGTSGGAGFWSGMNTTNSWYNNITTFNAGANNTTVGFTGTGIYGNGSGEEFNVLFFRQVEGFSSIGFYHGNGLNTNPPEVKTGFRPKVILVKSVEGTGNWVIHTDQQDFNYNERPLFLNLSNQEADETSRGIIFLSDGFRINNLGSPNADLNTDNIKYIYMAFAAHPTKYSVSSFFSDFSTSQNLTA